MMKSASPERIRMAYYVEKKSALVYDADAGKFGVDMAKMPHRLGGRAQRRPARLGKTAWDHRTHNRRLELAPGNRTRGHSLQEDQHGSSALPIFFVFSIFSCLWHLFRPKRRFLCNTSC